MLSRFTSRIFFLSSLILFAVSLHGAIEISVGDVEGTNNKSFVSLELRNSFDKDVKDARVWVFLMDREGNVVGNKSQWVIGGDSRQREPLGVEASQDLKLTIDTKSKATQAKVTFSRIILEDGSIVDPRKSVVSKD